MRKLARFAIKSVLMFVIFSYLDSGFSLYLPVKATAEIVGAAVRVLNIGFAWNGHGFVSGSGFVSIDWDCTGWKSMFLFLTLVVSSTESLQRVLKSFIFLPVLYIINIARIVALMWYMSEFGMSGFKFLHTMLFGYLSIAASLALWAVWMRWTHGR